MTLSFHRWAFPLQQGVHYSQNGTADALARKKNRQQIFTRANGWLCVHVVNVVECPLSLVSKWTML
jgi:hypothetical protein